MTVRKSGKQLFIHSQITRGSEIRVAILGFLRVVLTSNPRTKEMKEKGGEQGRRNEMRGNQVERT